MSADLWILLLGAANLVCALLIGARVLAAFPQSRTAQLVALICLCVAAHVILARNDYRGWIAPAFQTPVGGLKPVLDIVRNLTPGLFMILVHRLFTDRRRLPPWLAAAFALEIFLEEPVRWLGFPVPPVVGEVIPTLLQMLFAGCALYWTLADWRADLVETRRRARLAVMVILAINVVASSLLLRVIIPPNIAANYQAHLVLSVINLVIAVFLLIRVSDADVAENLGSRPASSVKPAAVTAESGADLARLVALVETERLYREPGLTLKALADRAGVPEYRARRLIHEGLGYRNFNAFLHAHRIREACEQLTDPALRRTPILTIALTVGYQSLNTFNRGFREVMGTTPSTYRAGGAVTGDSGQKPQNDPSF